MWWHTVTHGRGNWRGNWRIQCVASTLHTTSEHGVSSITTADAAHLGCQQLTELTPPPGRFKWTRPFRTKDEIWFLRMCHHISTDLYPLQKAPGVDPTIQWVLQSFTRCNYITAEQLIKSRIMASYTVLVYTLVKRALEERRGDDNNNNIY